MKKVILNTDSLHIAVKTLLGVMLFLITFAVFARGVYQSDNDFLAEAFSHNVPKSQVIWMKGDVRISVANILGHNYTGLRIRYWQDEQRSVWVLEEIGKTEPITFGVVIADNKVVMVKVLAFRESRGDEIRHPAFTRQFKHAKLDDDQLDRHINSISGATLSVRAMTKVVRLALYLAKNH